MARVKLTFRQRDLAAAIKAAQAAGLTVARLIVGKDDCVIVELAPPGANGPAPDPEMNNPWDELLNEGNQAP
jgi:hypothetical protein